MIIIDTIINWLILISVYALVAVGKISIEHGTYFNSIRLIVVCVFFSAVFATEINLIKFILEKLGQKYKVYFKYFISIVTIWASYIIFNVLYNLLYKIAGETIIFSELFDDIFFRLPHRLSYQMNFGKANLIINIILSIAIILLAISEITSKNKKYLLRVLGYFIQEFLKNILVFPFIFSFYCIVKTISPKYIFIYYAQTIGNILVIGTFLYTIIKTIVEIHKVKNINKNGTNGRENLIEIIDTENYKFNLNRLLFNNMKHFYGYSNSNYGNKLVVDSGKYVFVSYNAIKFGLIEQNNFKIKENIIFANIGYGKNSYNDFDNEKLYSKDIKYIIFNNRKDFFEIFYDNQSRKSEDIILSSKYNFKLLPKFDIKAVINNLELDKDDSTFKKLCYDSYIEVEKSTILKEYDFIYYSLENILLTFNYVEYFYNLLLIDEYIIQYLGLAEYINVVNNNDEEIIKANEKKVSEGSLAAWAGLIDYSIFNKLKNENIEKINDAINEIIEILTTQLAKKNLTEKFKEVPRNNEQLLRKMVKMIIELRNEIKGHGIITFDFSKKIVNDLALITTSLINLFINTDMEVIYPEDKIELFDTKFKACLYNDEFYMYSCFIKSNKSNKKNKIQYINYKKGKVINGDYKTDPIAINLFSTDKEIDNEVANTK